ncbi:MAG TPA: nuclear transport factor 2 family protein [Acidimicrobiales bacterium]|nr:nuclear transport factor 2 family protein [Acidimicrobiales bacterium]
MPTPADAATTYFDAWRAADFERLRTVLADDVQFTGPMGTADGADECLAGLRGLRQMLDDIVVERRWVDGPDVVTWFALDTQPAGRVEPVVNWSHVEEGRITRIRVTFDPRPLTDGA